MSSIAGASTQQKAILALGAVAILGLGAYGAMWMKSNADRQWFLDIDEADYDGPLVPMLTNDYRMLQERFELSWGQKSELHDLFVSALNEHAKIENLSEEDLDGIGMTAVLVRTSMDDQIAEILGPTAATEYFSIRDTQRETFPKLWEHIMEVKGVSPADQAQLEQAIRQRMFNQ